MAEVPLETNLIQNFLAPLAGPAGLGLVDDAACFTPNPGMDLVISADMIVADIHFLKEDNPYDIAIKAVTVNLSDLVAKGAHPVGYILTISFPQQPTADWMHGFCSGLATHISGKLLGGDITIGRGPLTISMTAIGEVNQGEMVTRSGAMPGDGVYVAGPIGTSFVGLKTLSDEKWLKQTSLNGAELSQLRNIYRAPLISEPSLTADVIRKNATASLDVSDGLAIDLARLCAASSVGAQIDVSKIPLDPIVKRLVDQELLDIKNLITGGDDYTALFTMPIKGQKVALPDNFQLIGTIIEMQKGVIFKQKDGEVLNLGDRWGYDHFQAGS